MNECIDELIGIIEFDELTNQMMKLNLQRQEFFIALRQHRDETYFCVCNFEGHTTC